MLKERIPTARRTNYFFDGLGSMVGLTKGDGTKENSYDYDPYGNMLHQTEGVSNPWKFGGGFLDSSTGLYKFGTRYDDPTLGRWTQQDPVGGSLGHLNAANRYTYASDDPVNVTDPSGKDVLGCIAVAFSTYYGLYTLGDTIVGAAVGTYFLAAFVSLFLPVVGIIIAIADILIAAALLIALAIEAGRVVQAACG